MRRLWLDFQRPEPGRQRLGTRLLGASLLAAGALWVQYSSLAGKVDAAQRQVSQLKRESMRQQPTATAERSASPAASEAGPSHSIASWEALFAALEAASSDSVTLLGLQPGRGEIQLIGEAKDLAASMDYVKRLQSAKMFATAHLTQSDVVMEHPEHPVRFTLVADWRGA